jgi:hypothetical protein
MPRLRDEILNCVVYLYSSFEDADLGINIGGSGFVVRIPSEHPELVVVFSHIYAVTNRHVIDEGFPCVRFNTQVGGRLVVEAKPNDWYVSETDDLAVAPMPQMPSSLKASTIPVSCLVKRFSGAKWAHQGSNLGPAD